MKSIYDSDSKENKFKSLIVFAAKTFLIIICLIIIAIGVFFYLFVQSLKSWDDANLVCSTNSKESWEYFRIYIDSTIETIENVAVEDHSNIRQRDYTITFDTDSGTLFKLIEKKKLVRERDYPNTFTCKEGRTQQSITFSCLDSSRNFHVTFGLTDCGISWRDTACDAPDIRCGSDIIDKEVEFNKAFYEKYKDSLSFHIFHPVKDCKVYYTIYSDGSVDSVSIVDKWNSFDDKFKRYLIKEFKKVNFGAKTRKKPINWSFPVIFP